MRLGLALTVPALQRGQFSACERSNPNKQDAEKPWGHSPSGLSGYSHLLGGYAGGQAEFLRVPYADVGPLKVPDELSDEQVLFLSDIFPTGYMAADFCNIQQGDTIAVWGCGPVGQFAVLLGAERVFAIDTLPERLALAKQAGTEVIDFKNANVYDHIQGMTKGRGADACIDAVGTEPDTTASADSVLDRMKVATFLGTDRPHVLRQAIHCCRNFGTVSTVRVYGGFVDKFPMGSAINGGLTHRPDLGPILHAYAAQDDPGRRCRPIVRDQAYGNTRRRSGALQDFPRQEGRAYQGCHQAVGVARWSCSRLRRHVPRCEPSAHDHQHDEHIDHAARYPHNEPSKLLILQCGKSERACTVGDVPRRRSEGQQGSERTRVEHRRKYRRDGRPGRISSAPANYGPPIGKG
jgi:NADPH:quinone reductase-like Zn-dependent oxidoreductase